MAEFLGIRTRSGNIVQPPGEPVIHKFDFAFNTPGLTTGVSIYTPTVGDILLDAWVEIDTAFDGTTPQIDIGQFLANQHGWYDFASYGPVDATVADSFQMDSAGVLSGSGSIVHLASSASVATPIGSVTIATAGNTTINSSGSAFTTILQNRFLPAKFTTANPVKLVVSQDGTKGGASSASTVGNGTAYLYVGTPV